jgi:chaperonin GroES
MKIPNIGPLQQMILFGDRILIQPSAGEERTSSGLYLPPSVKEKEEIRSGKVVKVGPGYPMPSDDYDDFLKGQKDIKYLPLQVHEGDVAVYLHRQAWEIEFQSEKYVIVPQSAILMMIRDELEQMGFA